MARTCIQRDAALSGLLPRPSDRRYSLANLERLPWLLLLRLGQDHASVAGSALQKTQRDGYGIVANDVMVIRKTLAETDRETLWRCRTPHPRQQERIPLELLRPQEQGAAHSRLGARPCSSTSACRMGARHSGRSGSLWNPVSNARARAFRASNLAHSPVRVDEASR